MLSRKSLIYILAAVFLIILLFFLSKFVFTSSFSFFSKIPAINQIVIAGKNGKENMKNAQLMIVSGDYEEASRVLKKSNEEFKKGLEKLYEFDIFYTRYIPYSPLNTGKNLFLAGIEGTKIAGFTNYILWTLVTEKNIGKSLISLESAIYSIDKLGGNLGHINTLFLPQEIKKSVSELNHGLDQIATYKDFFLKHSRTFRTFFGEESAKTYAVLLQNTAEARANGGFIGSILLFTTQSGKITSYELKDTHLLDFESGLYIPAPEYYTYIPRIDLKEANYTPDIRISGERIISLLEKSGGPTVSAVFFIDDQILPYLLEITGPLKVSGFTEEINKDNYFIQLQYDLEKRNIRNEDRVKNPKEKFFNLIQAVVSKLIKTRPDITTLNRLADFSMEKHIQVYSRDENIVSLTDDLNLTGYFPEVKDNEDFFAIIHSTFFNKSNRFMQDNITHSTYIDNQGTLTDKVVIKRRHNYKEDLSFSKFEDAELSGLDSEFKNKFLDVLGRGTNLDLVRIYVPKGSVISKLNGLNNADVYVGEELGRTFFAFKLEISASEQKEIGIEYKLPFSLADSYSLYLWKQPGINNTIFKKDVISLESDESANLKKELSNQLNSDYYYQAQINQFLWIKRMTMTAQKIKLPSKSKMKIEPEFIPML